MNDTTMKQGTLTLKVKEIPMPKCRLYGGLCGNVAEYHVELSGNQYVDSTDVLVCETCIKELETQDVNDYQELTEQEKYKYDRSD